MDDILFIGDELGAVGYALAGLAVLTVEPGDTAAALDALAGRQELRLVLIGAQHAGVLGVEELARRIRLGTPPLMVVSDAAGTAALPDFTGLLKRRLGVAT
jgi:vacuolar-type H+-ATPase subunit F/Vma7